MVTDLISQREFARRIGVNERKVRYCIEKGKLSECVKYGEDDKPKIAYSIGIVEAEALGLIKLKSEKSTKTIDTPKGNSTEQNSEPTVKDIDTISGVSLNATFTEAARKEKVFKAQTAGLNAQILAGKYLEIEAVNFQLKEFGVLLKGKLESIPVRESDALISRANNREAFCKYLSQIIYNTLTDLSLTIKNN